jgi:DNA polymerase-3 subunit gamma/tau
MAYKILSLKWRPSNFSEVVGQDHISNALSNAIKLDRIAHAFTFSGPRGVGKTSTARILAKELNKVDNVNESIDIIEMDAASNRGIDEIRNLRESVNYAPANGKYKIYIIDEAHMLTKEAFNALLKTLEEPPSHVIFIFATTELYKMPETILSRTQRYDFNRLSLSCIKDHLRFVLKSEKIKFDDESIAKISEKSDGSMRDALSVLDQMICICDNNITIDKISSSLGLVLDQNYFKILSLVSSRNSAELFQLFDEIIESGISLYDFVDGLNKFLNKCILANSLKESQKYANFYKDYCSYNISLEEIDLLRIMEVCLKFQSSLRQISQPRIAMESLLLKLSYLDKSVDINNFFSNIKNNNIYQKDSSSKKIIDNNKQSINNPIVDKTLNDLEQVPSEKVMVKKDHIQSVKLSNIEDKVDKSSNKNKEIDSDKTDTNLMKNNKEDKINKGLTIKHISDEWNNILSSITKSNIIHSLEKVEIKELTSKKIIVQICELNEFMFKNLLNDIDLIQGSINKYFNVDLSLELVLKKNENSQKTESVEKKDTIDKDHPLFMDVLNEFEGELIK